MRQSHEFLYYEVIILIDERMSNDKELHEKIELEVKVFLEENYGIGFNVWRRCLVDLQIIIENIIPYDIRYGGIPSLYEAGEKSGEYFGRLITDRFDLEKKSTKEKTYYYDAFVEHIGMCTKVEFLGGEINIVRCEDGTMFANDYAKTGRNVCYHAAGFIAGATSAIMGRKFVVRETKCISAGDPHCEFVVQPKI
jgi:predicted hydrocarbon binding protein